MKQQADRIAKENMNDSVLLTTQQQKDFVKSMIPNFNDKTTIKLIHRGTRDGGAVADFHRNCDNKGPTIILAKSSVGRVCGGYTSLAWTSSGGHKSDTHSVLFSVDSSIKFTCSNNTRAVYHNSGYGPVFGKYTIIFLFIEY